jgi:hypothetical protein
MLPHFEVMNRSEPPIHYVKVPGIWEDNQNMEEAREVVSLVMRLLKHSPDKEIGVVTFNARQQDLVLDILEQEAIHAGVVLPEHLFVKNIENVQGDERDIIVFTTAYAPDKMGQLRLQFGSLNQEGGENRLNVAVTRAKEAIYLVCSIHPDQLNTENTRNAGPKLLKEYLAHAYRVSEGQWQPNAYVDQHYQASWYLRKKLENASGPHALSLEKNLPFADLSVMQDHHYLGLVLTDDELYFSSLSAKQAHAYQYFHLTEKKWPNIRFFSRDYWIDRPGLQSRLDKFFERILPE